MYGDPVYIRLALKECARGWVLKGNSIDELVAAIRKFSRTHPSPGQNAPLP